jgi:hypothetical protein
VNRSLEVGRLTRITDYNSKSTNVRSRKSRSYHPKRLLENRIVFCADCDANRTLAVTPVGDLICSSCGSGNWMHRSPPLISNFRDYDEMSAQECLAINRYLSRLEAEFSIPDTNMPI